MPRQHQIERFNHHPLLPAAIPSLGWSRQRAARTGFPTHRHDCHELCLISEGTVDWWVDDQAFMLPPGSLYLTRPEEAHGTVNGQLQPCSLRYIQIDTHRLREKDIGARFRRLHGRVWHGADALITSFDRLRDELRQPGQDSNRAVKATLQLFLIDFLRLAEGQAAQPATPDRLTTFLTKTCDDLCLLRVNQLARQLGLSRSRLHQRFLAETGRSPKVWLTEFRLRRAAEMLADRKESITSIAMTLGFSSSQHFATAFRRYYNQTPRAYRQYTSAMNE